MSPSARLEARAQGIIKQEAGHHDINRHGAILSEDVSAASDQDVKPWIVFFDNGELHRYTEVQIATKFGV